MRDEALWQKLKEYDFDRIGGSLTFPAKLARDAQWSKAFTRRAIEEYRRFIYLTQVSDGEATPSAVVDLVWHMHLTYTREYWHGLCEGVLGRPLHHDPCLGEEENPRYEAQYDATCELYTEEFGDPPGDMWPSPGSRSLARSGAAMIVVGLVACYWSWAGAGLVVLGTILAIQSDPGGARRFVSRAAARAAGGCGGGGGGCGGGG